MTTILWKEFVSVLLRNLKRSRTTSYGFITSGKRPQLIQDEDYYFEKLKEDGFDFFLQIDEITILME